MIDVTTFDDNALDNFIKAATAEKEKRAQSARKEAISKLIEAVKEMYKIDCTYSLSFETDDGYLEIYMDDLLNELRRSL